MLEVEGITSFYGGAKAIDNVSLSVKPGEIVCLLGSNGAGKSTTLRNIAGLIQPSSGSIRWRGEDLLAIPASQRVKHGLATCPEGRRLFPGMTVLENLRMGRYGIARSAKAESSKLDEIYELFPRLLERRGQFAGTLSGGEQQMAAIGRALMAEPKLLMLDEPSLGLAPKIVDDILAALLKINKRGVDILLVEQNAHIALQAATRGYVMETGSIVHQGSSHDLVSDDSIRRAYLGL